MIKGRKMVCDLCGKEMKIDYVGNYKKEILDDGNVIKVIVDIIVDGPLGEICKDCAMKKIKKVANEE